MAALWDHSHLVLPQSLFLYSHACRFPFKTLVLVFLPLLLLKATAGCWLTHWKSKVTKTGLWCSVRSPTAVGKGTFVLPVLKVLGGLWLTTASYIWKNLFFPSSFFLSQIIRYLFTQKLNQKSGSLLHHKSIAVKFICHIVLKFTELMHIENVFFYWKLLYTLEFHLQMYDKFNWKISITWSICR